MQGVTPSAIVDDSLKLSYFDQDTGLSPTEQLYTARGSQSAAVRQTTIDKVGIDPSNYWDSLLLENTGYGNENTYYQKRAIWTTENKMEYTDGTTWDYMLVNIPTLLYMT